MKKAIFGVVSFIVGIGAAAVLVANPSGWRWASSVVATLQGDREAAMAGDVASTDEDDRPVL
jgi:hypothetical protein